MITDTELSDDQRKVLGLIEKLLRLADKNPNPEEAASAAAKAQELLLAHNLSADLVGQGADSGRREEQRVRGGFYQYQRDLWSAVAELNFCFHFMSGGWIEVNKRTKGGHRYVDTRWEPRHRLIGRVHNVTATKAMSTYLEQAIERLVEERIAGQNNLRFSRFAVSFREGAADDIISRVWQKRQHQLSEERRQRQEAADRAAEAGRKGVSTETAVTIASLTQSEHDANRDFLMGEPGYSARKRAERAAEAAARVAAEAEYTRWAAENPEEARQQEAARRAEAEKAASRSTRRSSSGPAPKAVDRSAYYAGRDAARSIGLDPQASATKAAGRLG